MKVFVKSNVSTFLICFYLTLLLFFVASCAKPPEHKVKNVPVKVNELQLESFEDTSNYVSNIISRKSTNLYPRITGPITDIYVKDGDFVKKDKLIMTIESSEQQSALREAEAKVNSSASNIEQAKATLKAYQANWESDLSKVQLTKIEYDRYNALYQKGSATKDDFDQATNNYKQAKAILKSSKEQINAQRKVVESQKSLYKEAEAETNKQKDILNYYNITAPFDGYIGYVPVRIGEYVSQNTALTSLTQNKTLEIQLAVDTDHKNLLKKDLIVNILDSNDKLITQAKIYFISPVIDTNNQTILANAVIDNSKNILKTGEVVKSQIVWGIKKGIRIPTESVINYFGQDFVFVMEKSSDNQIIAKKKPVKLGAIRNNKYLVLDNLKQGEKLIVSGIQTLRDNSPVDIQK